VSGLSTPHAVSLIMSKALPRFPLIASVIATIHFGLGCCDVLAQAPVSAPSPTAEAKPKAKSSTGPMILQHASISWGGGVVMRGPVAGPVNGPNRGPVAGPNAGPNSGPIRGPIAVPVGGPAGGPIPGRISFTHRNIYVTEDGDAAIVDSLAASEVVHGQNAGPDPTRFPVFASVNWTDYRTGEQMRKHAVIESLTQVRFVKQQPGVPPPLVLPNIDSPPKVDTTLAMPGEVGELVPGGNGRYLVLTIPAKHQVLVVDVREGKVTKTIELTSEKMLIAAGATRFVVADGEKRTLTRYAFATLAAEQEISLGTEVPRLIAMSEFGEGPLWMIDQVAEGADQPDTPDLKSRIRLLDLTTLKPQQVTVKMPREVNRSLLRVQTCRDPTLSAAGDVICLNAPSALCVIRNVNGSLELDGTVFATGRTRIRLFPDGKNLLMGFALQDKSKTVSIERPGFVTAPYTAAGDFFGVRIVPRSSTTGKKGDEPAIAEFHAPLEKASRAGVIIADIGTAFLKDLNREREDRAQNRRVPMAAQRFVYSPAEKVFSYVTAEPDRVLLKRFDVDAPENQIKRPTPADVAKNAPPATPKPAEPIAPPPAFTRGKPITFPLPKPAAAEAITYRLDSGPVGMSIQDGQVVWTPPADAPDQAVAIFGIEQAGRPRTLQVLHLRTEGVAELPAQPASSSTVATVPEKVAPTDYDRFTERRPFATAYHVHKSYIANPTIEREEPLPTDPRLPVPAGAVKRVYMKYSDSDTLRYRLANGDILEYVPIYQPFNVAKTTERFEDGSTVLTPVGLDQAEEVVPLPVAAADVVPAAGGRYLLLPLPSLQKIAQFDMRSARIEKYFDTASNDFLVAAGGSKFVVYDAPSRKLSRYDLASGMLEKTATLDEARGNPVALGMGVRSEGPLFYVGTGQAFKQMAELRAIDLASLAPQDLVSDLTPLLGGNRNTLSISDDGRNLVWTQGNTDYALVEYQSGRLREVKSKIERTRYARSISLDGRSVFDGPERQFFSDLKTPVGEGARMVGGDAYLNRFWYTAAFRPRPGPIEYLPIQFFVGEQATPLAQLTLDRSGFDRNSDISPSKRIHLAGAEKALALISDSPPRVAVKRFDIYAAMASSPTEPFAITSDPPRDFPQQEALTYQIETFSKRGGITYRLDAGPSDMTVSPKGLVAWRGPAAGAAANSTRGVVVAVADASGQELLHSFRVPSTETNDIAFTKPVEARPVFVKSTSGSTSSSGGPSGDLALNLPDLPGDPIAAGDGRYLLVPFPALGKVAVFDVAKASILRYVDIKSDRFHVAGGATRFIVVDIKGKTISRYRLETGELEKSIPYDTEPFDGAVHVAMGAASEGPLYLWEAGELRGHATPMRAVDLETLTIRTLTGGFSNSKESFTPGNVTTYLSASADGKRFGVIRAVGPNGTGYIYQLERDHAVLVGRPVYAGDDARIDYEGNSFLRTNERKYVDGVELPIRSGECGVNACSDDYWFSVYRNTWNGPVSVRFHRGHDAKQLANVEVGSLGQSDLRAIARLVFYSPREKTLSVVDRQPNRIIVKRFDAAAAIVQPGVAYLAFAGGPVDLAVPGTKLTHQLKAVSNDPKPTFKLVTGPETLTVAPSGLLEWQVPINMEPKVPLSVAVVDSKGTEVIRKFTLSAVEPAVVVAGSGGPSGGSSGAAARDALIVSVPMPGPIDRVAVGAGGRYLVAAIGSQKSIVVVDVKERMILKTIPQDDTALSVAAGATKFVVYGATEKKLHRYAFSTLEREATEAVDYPIADIAMGSQSEGPLLAVAPKKMHRLIQLQSLQPLVWVNENQNWEAGAGDSYDRAWAAADGKHFCAWQMSRENRIYNTSRVDSGGASTLVFDGRSLNPSPTATSPWLHVMTANGGVMHTTEGRHALNGRKLAHEPGKYRTPSSPSVTGDFYVGWSTLEKPIGGFNPLMLYAGEDYVPLAKLTRVPTPELPKDPMFDPLRNSRLTFAPLADAIVAIPPTDDRLLVYRLNIDEVLKTSTRDYLFAASLPPATVVPGTVFEYQLDVKSRRGNVAFRLETKPDGMEISPTGLIRWPAPPSLAEKQSVDVRFTDASGGEGSQLFDIAQFRDRLAVQRPSDVVQFDSVLRNIIGGGGGRYVIGFDAEKKQVVIVEVAEREVAHRIPVDEQPLLTAGAEKLILYIPGKNQLVRYDLKTGGREQAVPLEAGTKIRSLTMGSDSSGPLLADIVADDVDDRRRFERDGRDEHPAFFDPATLLRMTVKYVDVGPSDDDRFGFERTVGWQASSDGRLFSAVGSGTVIRFDGNVAEVRRGRSDRFSYAAPSGDGRLLLRGTQILNEHGDPLGEFPMQPKYQGRGLVPAERGQLFLGFYARGRDDDRNRRPRRPFEIYVPSNPTPIAEMFDIDQLVAGDSYSGTNETGERIFFAPHLSQIVTIPASADRLTVYPFDLEQELQRRVDDYLFILGPIPPDALRQKPWSHQLDIRSKRGGVVCKLESGPKGMTITPEGLLEWPSPPSVTSKSTPVVVSVNATGAEELLYVFPLRVVSEKPVAP